MNNSAIWVIIPAYNEGSVIGPVLEDIRKHGYAQVLVVDDGSEDNTYEVAKDKGAVVIRHEINRGVGAATETGLAAARKLRAEAVILMDADGQHEAASLDDLIKPVAAREVDLVFGNRFAMDNSIPLVRRSYNFIANVFTFLVSGLWLSDSQSGMKALGSEAINKIRLSSNSYEFASEMASEVVFHHLRWCEVPISVKYSHYSQAKGQNFRTGLETLIKLAIRSLMK